MSTAASLLAWFDRHRRDLPWRRDTDPYRIWVSEIMLQQTRVEVVVPYFERFLARFPTLETLAAADEVEVLALWSGLGYYRRGRQLLAAARQVVATGGFPRTVDGLRALPGIGEYTAAAVASMAFGVPAAVLDGNVERVLCRYLADGGDPKARATRERLRQAAEGLLVAARPGDSNQALMELGATLCLPRRPHCLLCPLAEGCAARRRGEMESYPRPKPRRALERQTWAALWVEREGRVLLLERPAESAVLAGTWELPAIEAAPDLLARVHREPSAAGELAALFAQRFGARWQIGDALGTVRHGITFRDLTITAFRAEVAGHGGVAEGRPAGWFSATERARLPLSSQVAKVAAMARRPSTGRSRGHDRRTA